VTGHERKEVLEPIDTLGIFTLLVRCPTGGSPGNSCPFAQYREQHTLEEKYRLAESLPENKRREMLAFHKHCQAQTHIQVNTLKQLK
jgi:hypothetical protein